MAAESSRPRFSPWLRREHAGVATSTALPNARWPKVALQGLPAIVRPRERGYGTRSRGNYLESRQKRALDVTAALTLRRMLLPLLIIVALLVRGTSKGPVLFRQKRCGRNGQPFEIYKFRSMHVVPDEAVVQATRADPRVTSVGRFIRRSSIDELPQLLNVLQGHMSLIGPRPHAMAHDAFYGERIPHYSDRFVARPGLSGLAQVRGARGGTPQLSDMERRIDLDLDYIRNASLALDLRIIAATVREMMFSSTAY